MHSGLLRRTKARVFSSEAAPLCSSASGRRPLTSRAMLDWALVDHARLRACFDEIEPQLYRFPAIDPAEFRRNVERIG